MAIAESASIEEVMSRNMKGKDEIHNLGPLLQLTNSAMPIAGTRSQRTLPGRDSTTEGKLAPGRLRVEETASGQRPLGVSLGGRNLQRNSGQFGTFMRSRDCWSE